VAHEDISREQVIEGSSDRSFGVVFAVVFFLIGAWPLIGGGSPRWWSVVIGALFLAVSFLRPGLLAGMNRWWMKLGLLLSRIVSPIALGILFYGVMMPIGALMRLSGKDPLRLKRDSDAQSYWIEREPPGPPPDSMTNQF
jgi:Saxitoxin biosynthesis operon protein SxtJ